MRLLRPVCSLMASQVARIAKGRVTFSALEGFVSGVNASVNSEMGRLGEGLATLCAPVRSVAAVGAKVDLEPVGVGEACSTLFTLVGTSTCTHDKRMFVHTSRAADRVSNPTFPMGIFLGGDTPVTYNSALHRLVAVSWFLNVPATCQCT